MSKQQNTNEVMNIASIKQDLEKGLARLSGGMTQKPETKMIMSRNILKLFEMKSKNSFMFNQILQSNNKNTAILAIVNNTLNGLILNEDFYLVSFGGATNAIVEVKNGRAWRKIAMQYSLKPIKEIKSIVLSVKDQYNTEGFPPRLVDVKIDFKADRTKFENIAGAYAEVEFKDGTFATRIMSIDEIKQLRSKSPSMSDKGKAFSPWTQYPFKMVESKILRDLVLREIDIDKIKMAKDGYSLVEDDTPIKIVETEDVVEVVNDYEYIPEVEEEASQQPNNNDFELLEEDDIFKDEV